MDLVGGNSEFLDAPQIVGRSLCFINVISRIPRIAKCNSSVLILGETGTGKEVCARKIHQLSDRATKPFLPVNCGAIPVELAENELFGHRRGAFTGAGNRKPGLIEEAEGGTIFLDEVDSLPPLVQVKLLRFLQDRTYRPLGSTKEQTARVRIIAAMNSDPKEVVQAGKLRQDLFYRLNVIELNLPPLRERKGDIPLLARHFLKMYAAEQQVPVSDFSARAMQKLLQYEWPGNVRELQHVIERTVAISDNRLIQYKDISLPETEPGEETLPFQVAKDRLVEVFEKTYIEKLLLTYQGNISQAARVAQKHRRAFWGLIQKHGIEVERFRSDESCSPL